MVCMLENVIQWITIGQLDMEKSNDPHTYKSPTHAPG